MDMTAQLERFTNGKTLAACTNEEAYAALLHLTKELCAQREATTGKKKLYYISAEFLIGKLLSNNLLNLGVYDEAAAALAAAGKSMAAVEDAEPEPSLGNGGLGRLAACFLDSIATLGLCGDGVGLNYHLGLFRQEFVQNRQREMPNPWLARESWLTRTDRRYRVEFGGFTVESTLYDLDVVGYGRGKNKLHLFDLDTVDESIVHDGIDFDKGDIRKNLTLFLYPDDSDEAGRLLRVYQQYFMVSCAAQLLLDECCARGSNLHDLADYAAVQINDTHPSMVIPELIRLLEQRGIGEDEAVAIVTNVCAYTNHTILAEALEKWPLAFIEKAAPQLVPVIRMLDARVRAACPDERVAILDGEGRVHMAHMDIHFSHSTNGVAALHTEILKNTELQPFYALYPDRFNNKTNGITFRRWLLACDPALTALIEELIGPGFRRDADELRKLAAFENDEAVLRRLVDVKRANKAALCSWMQQTQHIALNENAVFDIQVKRLHEYKRQQLNVLYLIDRYLAIKAGERPAVPVAAIFGAKAAPAYTIAKDIIHLILCLAEIVNSDPEVSPYLQVAMVENYNVTAAEKLIPACDISEQISLASKEASGTGNMKFMLNGAVTLGTLDGANVEIAQLVGPQNIYTFGRSSEEVIAAYARGDYRPVDWYNADARIRAAVDFIVSEQTLAVGDALCLARLQKELLVKDWFMTLPDFAAYCDTKQRMLADTADTLGWARRMLHNISGAGFFSSDRTIAQYNADIWHLGN